jgi:hypothetical protein
LSHAHDVTFCRFFSMLLRDSIIWWKIWLHDVGFLCQHRKVHCLINIDFSYFRSCRAGGSGKFYGPIVIGKTLQILWFPWYSLKSEGYSILSEPRISFPINTMVRYLKLVAFLDHFRAILGTLGPKTLLILKNGPWCWSGFPIL